jgi:poly-gamma-glutamate synthesis protein (capsule biosynthesis protein)
MRIFLCGDIMLGRGIDQILPHPCDPALHESYVTSALDYVRMAEAAHGPIPRLADPSYVWGDALEELTHTRPDARIVNLETSITRSEDFALKGINYRLSPENAGCLTALAPDCCALANNHVLDWGHAGLLDTLATLDRLHIKTAGAGYNAGQASMPACIDIAGKGRLVLYSFASVTSGTPRSWAATHGSAGVNLLTDLSEGTAAHIADQIAQQRQPCDIIVISIHWGPNWGYDVPDEQRRFAHALIDRADVSIVHGHSSHHAKAMEVYRNRLILYGCGDFLNDYEGIKGYEEYRDDLALMYFAEIMPESRDIATLEVVPLQIRQFRLSRPSNDDCFWVQQMLDRQCRRFNERITQISDGRLALSWSRNGQSILVLGRSDVTEEETHMNSATACQGTMIGPKRKSYDEGVDEPAKLIENEPVEVERETPAVDNQPVEQLVNDDKSNAQVFEE